MRCSSTGSARPAGRAASWSSRPRTCRRCCGAAPLYLTLTVAEALRDQGLSVLCLIDSVTRFAMALREIHLAAGEPPTSKGYPPSVFAELPRLLERAGPGTGAGSITGLFTVLVEGDDLNDPIADAVRAILDGHIVLDRRIAETGRFPALDVLRSLSRSAPGAYADDERPLVERARRLIRAYAETVELIQLGAYRRGSDPLIDAAIAAQPALETVLAPGDRRAEHAARRLRTARRGARTRGRSRIRRRGSPRAAGPAGRSGGGAGAAGVGRG